MSDRFFVQLETYYKVVSCSALIVSDVFILIFNIPKKSVNVNVWRDLNYFKGGMVTSLL